MRNRTKFSKWLMDKGYTSKLFASLIAKEMNRPSLPRVTVDNWRSGRAQPRAAALLAMQRISNGEIQLDWFVAEDGHAEA